MRRRGSALNVLAMAMLSLVVALTVGVRAASAQATTKRIAGQDRYGTMDALVREDFSSSDWAIVATAESFPDALSAAPLAGARVAPVILTSSSALSPQARDLVLDLSVKHVVIMGGESAVSSAVEASLSSLGVTCERIAGADRAQTSVRAFGATRSAGSASNTVIVATGSNFADALAIGPYAWRSASPILLADASGRLAPEAVAAVRADASVSRVVLVGGTAVVSDEVRGQLGDAYTYVRLAGPDRFRTAAEVARWSCENGLSWSSVAVVTGTGFADALSAAAPLGRSATPLLLVSDAATSEIRGKASSIGTCYVIGGTAVVSEAQARAVGDALAGATAVSSPVSTSSTTTSYSGSSSGTSYGSRLFAGPSLWGGYATGPVWAQPTWQPQGGGQATQPSRVDVETQSIGLEGVGNARQLGGYVGEGGRRVKDGVLLRTAALGGPTEADIARLTDTYHLATVLDFRMKEREVDPNPDPQIEGVRNINILILDTDALAREAQGLSPEDQKAMAEGGMARMRVLMKLGFIGDGMYVHFLSHDVGKRGYAQMFRELLALPEGRSLLFHCTQGKDRTGCAAMLILSALGVDEETIMADYMLTNEFNADLIAEQRQQLLDSGVSEADLDGIMIARDQVFPQTMTNALDWMKENYGSVRGYITSELGVTDAEIAQLQDKFLE